MNCKYTARRLETWKNIIIVTNEIYIYCIKVLSSNIRRFQFYFLFSAFQHPYILISHLLPSLVNCKFTLQLVNFSNLIYFVISFIWRSQFFLNLPSGSGIIHKVSMTVKPQVKPKSHFEAILCHYDFAQTTFSLLHFCVYDTQYPPIHIFKNVIPSQQWSRFFLHWKESSRHLAHVKPNFTTHCTVFFTVNKLFVHLTTENNWYFWAVGVVYPPDFSECDAPTKKLQDRSNFNFRCPSIGWDICWP